MQVIPAWKEPYSVALLVCNGFILGAYLERWTGPQGVRRWPSWGMASAGYAPGAEGSPERVILCNVPLTRESELFVIGPVDPVPAPDIARMKHLEALNKTE